MHPQTNWLHIQSLDNTGLIKVGALLVISAISRAVSLQGQVWWLRSLASDWVPVQKSIILLQCVQWSRVLFAWTGEVALCGDARCQWGCQEADWLSALQTEFMSPGSHVTEYGWPSSDIPYSRTTVSHPHPLPAVRVMGTSWSILAMPNLQSQGCLSSTAPPSWLLRKDLGS